MLVLRSVRQVAQQVCERL